MEENRILELNPRLLYYLGLCCFGKYWSSPYTRTFVELASASSRNLNVRVTFLNNDLWGEDSLKKVKPANLSYQVWISQNPKKPKSQVWGSPEASQPEFSSLKISRNLRGIKSEYLKKPPSYQVWISQKTSELSSLNISRNLRAIKSEYLKSPETSQSELSSLKNSRNLPAIKLIQRTSETWVRGRSKCLPVAQPSEFVLVSSCCADTSYQS